MASEMDSNSIREFQALFVLVFVICEVISVAPVDTVGCYGGLSTFYCESDREDLVGIEWTINGTSITDEVAELRGISITNNGVGNSSLSIIGSEDNNGIYVGCNVVVSFGPPYVDSKAALFTVSDIPPVANFTITITNNGTIMNCTWKQPSCLPVNYWYSISINNVTVTNTTSTVYSISNMELCTNYTVSVTVTDGQYQSIPAEETAQNRISEDFNIGLRTTRVYFIDDMHCSVDVEFQISKQYRSHVYQLFYNCIYDIYDVIVPPMYSELGKISVNDLLTSYNESTGIGNYTIGLFNSSFRATYILKNHNEEIASTRISTFNVQNANISQTSNGSTMMECVFAYNSPADGCLFEIVSQTTGNEHVTSRIITKDENEDTATLYTDLDIPEGEYDVHVYDTVNGEIKNLSAYELSYTHTIVNEHEPPPNGESIIVLTSSSSTDTNLTPSITYDIITSPTGSPTVDITLSSTLPSFVLIAIVCGVTGIVLLMMIIVIGIIIAFKVNCRRRQKAQHNYNADSAMVKLNTATPHLYDDLPAAVNVTAIQQNTSVTPIIQHSSPLITSQNDNTVERVDIQATNVDDNDEDCMVDVDDLHRNSAADLKLQSPLYHDVPSTESEYEEYISSNCPTLTDPVSQSHDPGSQCLPLYDDGVVTRPEMNDSPNQDIKDSPHHPIPRLTESKPVYATIIDPTRKVSTQQSCYPVYVNTGIRKQNEQNPLIINGKVVGSMLPAQDSDRFTPVHGVTQQNNGEDAVSNETIVTYQEESHAPSPDRYAGISPSESIIMEESFPLPYFNDYSMIPITSNNKQNNFNLFINDTHEHNTHSEMSEFYEHCQSFHDHEHCQSLHESIYVGGAHVYSSPMVMKSNLTIPTHEDTRPNFDISSETKSHQIIEEIETEEESNDLMHDIKPSSVIDDTDTSSCSYYWEQVVTDFPCLLKLVFDGGRREGELPHYLVSSLCLLFGLIFDGGGVDQGMGNPKGGPRTNKVLNIITWWYTARKWLYDEIVKELNLAYGNIIWLSVCVADVLLQLLLMIILNNVTRS